MVLIWLILAMGAVFIVLIFGIMIATGVAVPGHSVAAMESSSDGNTIAILTSVLTLMLAVGAGESHELQKQKHHDKKRISLQGCTFTFGSSFIPFINV